MSDTPRADAQQDHVQNAFNEYICKGAGNPDAMVVPADFARELERENARLRVEIAHRSEVMALLQSKHDALAAENSALLTRVKRLEEAVSALSARIPCGECETEGPGVPCKLCALAQASAAEAKEDKP